MKLNRIEPEEEFIGDKSTEEESLEDDEGYYDDLTDDYYEEGQPPMEKKADLLKGLTNFDPYLKNAFNNWLGMTWDEKEQKFKENKLIEPIMNIKGAAWCSGILKTYARDNNILTDISYDEYRYIMMDHLEAIWINLGARDDLGIKEDGDLLRVCNELEHSAALALMGAGEGKYKQFLGTTVSRHENINPNQQQMPMGYPGGYPMQPGMLPQRTGVVGKLKRMIMGR